MVIAARRSPNSIMVMAAPVVDISKAELFAQFAGRLKPVSADFGAVLDMKNPPVFADDGQGILRMFIKPMTSPSLSVSSESNQ